MTQEMKENRLRHIEGAIWAWEERLKGDALWWDKKEYSKDWILEQITFFKEMKLCNEKT